MASSRVSLSGPDVVDVLAVMRAFEEINQCRIRVELITQDTKRTSVLQVVLVAWQKGPADAAPVILACEQSTYGWFSVQSLDTVILQGLYKLDAAIDRNVPVLESKKERSSPAIKS